MFIFKEILNRAKAFTLRKCKIFFKKTPFLNVLFFAILKSFQILFSLVKQYSIHLTYDGYFDF